MNIVDICMVVFILVMMLIGVFKGFVKMIMGLVSSVIAFIAAVFLAKPIVELIKDLPVFDGMQKAVTDFFTNNADFASKNVQQTIDSINIPAYAKDFILKGFPDPAQAINSGALALSERVFYIMLLAIVSIVLFIVVRVAFCFIEMLIQKTFDKVKTLDTINRFLGAIFGVANAALIIYIALAIVALLSSQIPSIANAILESAVVSKLYNNNLLLLLFG